MVVVVVVMDTKIITQPSGSVAGKTLPNVRDVVHEIMKSETKEYTFWIMHKLRNDLDAKIAIRYGLTKTGLMNILSELKERGMWVYWISSYKDYLIIEFTASTEQYSYSDEDIRGAEFEVL